MPNGLLEGLDALVHAIAYVEYRLQLQKLYQLHNFGRNVAQLKLAVAVLAGSQDGKQHAKTGTIDVVDSYKVKH
jgi:predicted component of viral defense system (DUF524 family)